MPKSEQTKSTRVDLPESLHKKAKAKAALEGLSLKGWLQKQIEAVL